LLQPDFVKSLFDECKNAGLHTALDTSGHTPANYSQIISVLEATDLVLLDIKAADPSLHQWMTGCGAELVLHTAGIVKSMEVPVILRHVLVPGITDSEDHLKSIADLAQTFDNLVTVEILPYHRMALYKWHELGLNNTLEEIREATSEDVERAYSISGLSKYINKGHR
jgi:pyruvate formate lyase activating enzyme